VRNALKRIARGDERPEQVERFALATCDEPHVARIARVRQDADRMAHQGWLLCEIWKAELCNAGTQPDVCDAVPL